MSLAGSRAFLFLPLEIKLLYYYSSKNPEGIFMLPAPNLSGMLFLQFYKENTLSSPKFKKKKNTELMSRAISASLKA